MSDTNKATKHAAPTKADLKTATCAYLYPNGLCLILHEKRDKDAGRVEFYTLWKTDIQFSQQDGWQKPPVGYMIRRGWVPFLFHTGLKHIEYYSDNCSERSKERGIHIEGIHLHCRDFDISIHLLPGVINSDFEPCLSLGSQTPDYDEMMEKGYHHSTRIANSGSYY